MKSLLYIFISLVVILVTFSCKEDTFLTYEDNDQIYFLLEPDNSTPFRDSIDVTFMYTKLTQTDSVVKLPVKVLGNLSEQDRPFKYTIDPLSTAREGIHYEIISSFIPAGMEAGNLIVKLLRSEDLKEERVSLYFHLEENEWFTTLLSDLLNEKDDSLYSALDFKLYSTDQFIMPSYWSSRYEPYFGTFSEKKMRLIAELMNVQLVKFLDLSVLEMTAYGTALKRYLQQQTLQGTPVYEEDGTLMTAGTRV